MRELFIWYRVADDRAAATRALVLAMQRSLTDAWPGLEARLLIRHGGSTGQTWMETYARRDVEAASLGGVDASLEATIVAAARPLVDWIDGERHGEAFDSVTAT